MKILIIGGYGSFGRRLTENLLQYHNHDLVIAGRSIKKAKQFQTLVQNRFERYIDVVAFDVESPKLVNQIKMTGPDIVVNASGPYQYQCNDSLSDDKKNYTVARACIANGCHYIDLADDRQFVNQFSSSLSVAAEKQGCMLVSGASTVPGLTCAVVDTYQTEFRKLHSIYFGIAPANRFRKGAATVGSILSYTGCQYPILKNNKRHLVYGWQGLRRYDFGPPIGLRWMANCQIPDLDILPQRYPSLDSVNFQAGLELGFMHFSMWLLSGLRRLGLVSRLQRFANLLSTSSQWFDNWGSDNGGMFVQLAGTDHQGMPKTIDWQLIAENGEGPNVPVISAELIIRRIAKGEIVPGAMPCVGLFTLEDFFTIASRWGIHFRLKEENGRRHDQEPTNNISKSILNR